MKNFIAIVQNPEHAQLTTNLLSRVSRFRRKKSENPATNIFRIRICFLH